MTFSEVVPANDNDNHVSIRDLILKISAEPGCGEGINELIVRSGGLEPLAAKLEIRHPDNPEAYLRKAALLTARRLYAGVPRERTYRLAGEVACGRQPDGPDGALHRRDAQALGQVIATVIRGLTEGQRRAVLWERRHPGVRKPNAVRQSRFKGVRKIRDAVRRAGYDPRAIGELWDQLAA